MSRIAFLCLVALALGLAAPAAAADTRITRVDAEDYPSVRVTLVAADESREAPVVTENGRPVSPTRVDNFGRGKSVVVAIDRSQSMEGPTFDSAVAAARTFVRAKSGRDRVAIFGFGSRAVRLTRFSSATIDADLALRGLAVDAVQGTALYDTIVAASHAFATETLRSRVIVVLTDGADVSSAATLREAIGAARRAGAAVHAIALESEQFSPAALRRIARETGGSYNGAASADALGAVYAKVGARLRHTWQVEYLTSARRGDRIDVRAEGAGVGLVVPGTPPAGPTKPSSLVPEVAYSGGGPLLFGLLAGALILFATLAATAARRGSRLRNRLAPHVEERRRARHGGRMGAGATTALMQATERAFGKLSIWRRTQKLLERADLPLRTVEFVYIAAGSCVVVGLIAAAAGLPVLLVLMAFAGGAFAPYAVLMFKAKRRLKMFEEQLPDIMLTIAASLKAGHSFKQGLQSVADEGDAPASTEFQRALAEIRLGRPIEDALRELAERVDSKNLDFVITAVSIQSQVGGSLAALFDMVGDAVRQRQQFARKIKGLTAMGRASAYVLVGLPVVLAGIITVINPEYMEPLFDTTQGRMMMGFGLVMIAIGSLVLKKIVSFRG